MSLAFIGRESHVNILFWKAGRLLITSVSSNMDRYVSGFVNVFFWLPATSKEVCVDIKKIWSCWSRSPPWGQDEITRKMTTDILTKAKNNIGTIRVATSWRQKKEERSWAIYDRYCKK